MDTTAVITALITTSGMLGVAVINAGGIRKEIKSIKAFMTAEREKRDYCEEMNEVIKNALIHIEEKSICRYSVELTKGFVEIAKQALDKNFTYDDADLLLTRFYADYEQAFNKAAEMLGPEFAGLYFTKIESRYKEFSRDLHEIFTDEVNSKHYRFKTLTKMYVQHILSQLVKQWYFYQSLQGIRIKKGETCTESYHS